MIPKSIREMQGSTSHSASPSKSCHKALSRRCASRYHGVWILHLGLQYHSENEFGHHIEVLFNPAAILPFTPLARLSDDAITKGSSTTASHFKLSTSEGGPMKFGRSGREQRLERGCVIDEGLRKSYFSCSGAIWPSKGFNFMVDLF